MQNVLQSIDMWKRKISAIAKPNAKVLLIETKCDLKDVTRYINLRQITAFVELWKSEEPTKAIAFMPVSSRKVLNVEAALKWICDGVVSDIKYSLEQY